MAKKKRKARPVERHEEHAGESHAVAAEDGSPGGGVEKVVLVAIVIGVVAIFVVSPAGGKSGHGKSPSPAASARVLEPPTSPEELEAEEAEGELDPDLAAAAEDDEPIGEGEAAEGEEVEELELVPEGEEEGAAPQGGPAKAEPAKPEPAKPAPTAAPKPAAPALPKPPAAQPKPAAPKPPAAGDNPY